VRLETSATRHAAVRGTANMRLAASGIAYDEVDETVIDPPLSVSAFALVPQDIET
jgi:hypothetical protein